MELHMLVFCCLSVCAYSIPGVATRLALLEGSQSTGFFRDDTLFAANALGSFFLGFLVQTPLKLYLPVFFAGLGSGYCGSLTSFSGWVLAIYNSGNPNAVAQLFSGLTIPFIAFLFGEDVAQALLHYHKTPTEADGTVTRARHWFYIDMGLLIAAVVLAIAIPIIVSVSPNVNRADLYACVLGPIGALTRFLLSYALNDRWTKLFQVGTFVCNVLGVILMVILVHCSQPFCAYSVLGVCGALTTVSSWVNDTVKDYRADKRFGYLYCLTTTAICVAIGAFVYA